MHAFLRGPAAGLQVQAGCDADERTVAVLVTRNGADSVANRTVALRTFLEDGGTVITEAGIANEVAASLLGLAELPREGARSGSCTGEVVPAVLFHEEDPVWRETVIRPLPLASTGCGNPIDFAAIPGFVPLGGWSPPAVSLGYVQVDLGRLWLVEADWQSNRAVSEATLDLMAYMLAAWHDQHLSACQNALDNDGDGAFDLYDPGCTDENDATEAPNPGGAGAACGDAADNDANGSARVASS